VGIKEKNMNAMVQFKSNVSGIHVPTSAQRMEAMKEMASVYQARQRGLVQNYLKKILKTTGAKSLSTGKSADTQSTNGNTQTSRISSRELSSDTFLKLLVMQMQYQDPLEPVENTAMLAQLAQFSALEQSIQTNASMVTLQKEIQNLSQNVQYMSLSASQQMIGKYIEGASVNGDPVRGKVDAVSIENGTVLLSIGSVKVPITNIQSVRSEQPETK